MAGTVRARRAGEQTQLRAIARTVGLLVRPAQGVFEPRHQLRAWGPERIEGATLHETLQHALVDLGAMHPRAKVIEIGEWALLPRLQNDFDRFGPNAFDRA